ncbi:MAG: acetyltransferase [Clostridiales bacterium]|nr:acetyltransferase [Clostridiales bacterium]
MKDLVIIGAGGHGRVVADIAQKLGVYANIFFLDDGDIKETMGLPVVGKTFDAEKFIDKADLFVAIGNNQVRRDFNERLLKLGADIPTLIHPSANIGACVEIGLGSAVMAGTVVNPCSKLGKGVILNTCSSIDHDCVVGDYCHIAVGSHVAGTVKLGENVCVGAGAIIKNNVEVCANCVIGAGAVVVKNIIEEGTYIGVPAKRK